MARRRVPELAANMITQPNTSQLIARIPLTAANFLGMNAAVLALIAAPGAGKLLSVEEILLKMVRTATAFANGGALEFRYTDANGAKASADIPAAIVTTGGAGTEYAIARGVTTILTPVINSGLFMRNAAAPFISGTGTGVLFVKYRIWTP